MQVLPGFTFLYEHLCPSQHRGKDSTLLNPTRTQPSLCRKHPASLFHCTLMQQEKEQNLSIDLCKGRHLGNAHTGSYISIHSAICMSVRKLES